MAGVSNIKLCSIAVIVVLVLTSLNLYYGTEEIKQNSFKPKVDNIEDAKKNNWNNDEEVTQGSRAPINLSNLTESNSHGGSWVDNFKDLNGIEFKLNLIPYNFKSDSNDFRLARKSYKFSDRFEDTDGTTINSYNSSYTIYNSANPGLGGAEIDTAQKYEGSSSALSYLNQFAREVCINRTVNFSQPTLEFNYFQRVYTTQSLYNYVGCVYDFRLFSGNNRISIVNFYAGDIHYWDGSSFINTSKTISHSTWYKIKMVVYKANDKYSTYDFSVWDTNNMKTPVVSRTGLQVYTSGCSYIDKICIRIQSGWDTNCYGWTDDLNITAKENKFNSTGYLLSKPITLHPGMTWDSVIINKTTPANSAINLSIHNATNNNLIYGPITTTGEVSIRSKVDSNLYPSIKLNATFYSNGSVTPLLHYWGVSWNATNAWRDTLFGGLKENSNSLTNGEGETWLLTSLTDWYKYSGNPILKPSTGSSWDSVLIANPMIVYNGTGYLMWYYGYDGSASRIGLATSIDGITWIKDSGNPVLTTSSSGWDSRYLISPCVLFDGENYKMWYTGQDALTDRRIGYAVSTDGRNWQKHSANPVIDKGSSGQWDDHYAVFPYVYFDGLNYKMWYSGLRGSVGHYQMGYATSYDGFNWNKYSNNPIIHTKTGYYMGIYRLAVIPQNNFYFGWYDSGNSTGTLPRYINHTYSTDGIYWVNYTNNPILQKGGSGLWDEILVANPEVIFKDKQYWMYYSGKSGSLGQIGLAKSKFKSTGSITSTTISLPFNGRYDKLVINKTEPTGTYINVSILNGSSLLTIPNFENIRGNVIDISSLSAINYPSIVLKATFESTGFATPVLYDWSVNWKKNAAPEIIDIFAPIIVNRTHSVDIAVNLSDNEEPEEDLTLKVDYRSPYNTIWETDYLTTPQFINDRWVCTFTPAPDADLGIYAFRFTCNDSLLDYDRVFDYNFIEVRNNLPIIWDISTDQSDLKIHRSKPMKFFINASDVEIPVNVLDIEVKYRPIQDSSWRKISSSDIYYTQGLWQANFTPTITAKVGIYDFNITCNDSDAEVYKLINIKVLNNLPTQPEVTISPDEPRTMDDLIVIAENSFDIETYWKRIKYWYRWYRDDFYVPSFENMTLIPYTETTKGQTWRCVAYPFDGDDLGPFGEASVTILNTPPELDEPFDEFVMDEDSIEILENKLTQIFTDADADELIFSVTGQNKINVTISPDTGTIKLIPEENWFGTEFITFYANDTESVAAQETVRLIVSPTNDLPEIVKVGDKNTSQGYPELTFEVDEDDWLYLDIDVEDIDGDVERNMIKYLINISNPDYIGLVENTLIFNPHNEHVGWHYVNISITDGNETPWEFISQHIKIHVRNTNDPPTVEIIEPMDAQEFLETDWLNFNCIAGDVDLLIPNSKEKLIIRWYVNGTQLGIGPELINQTLAPGIYNITVEVIDEANTTAYDSIHIIIKDVLEDKPRSRTTVTAVWFWLLLLMIIIIIIGTVLFILHTKKKKRFEALGVPRESVLHPVEAYLPESRLTPASTIAHGAQLAQPTIMQSKPLVTPVPTLAEPRAQLPPVQPTMKVQTETMEQEQRSGIDSRLTPQQKLELLEERLLRGEIDQKIYMNLKEKYEMEAKTNQPK